MESKKLRDYFQPKSLTWWGGIFAIVLGVVGIVIPHDYRITEIGMLIMLLLGEGSGSPAMMIATGMGLIGIRAKQERDSRFD